MNLISGIKRHHKVMENYFFMTLLQVLNSAFYLLIYPYLIRKLGSDGYGNYVFVMSIVLIFITIVNFGFDFTGVKSIAENINKKEKLSYTLSAIFTVKLLLSILVTIFYFLLVLFIPKLYSNRLLFYICFFNIFTNIFFPIWYFQGIQQMKIVTYIQVLFKFISLPFIFFLIKLPSDLYLFAFIILFFNLLGAFSAFVIIVKYHKLKICFIPISKLKNWVKEAFPFFLSNSMTIVKEQILLIIIGLFYSMTDVAIFDLAKKVLMVPRIIFSSVNNAIFPKFISEKRTYSDFRKILVYEALVSFLVITLIALFGKWIIEILSGGSMSSAYIVVLIMSITILTWLLVGAYIYFIFIPNNMYYHVSINQVIALVSMIIYIVIGFFFTKSILVLAIALSLSGLTELLYCFIVVRKKKLYLY